MIKKKNKDKRKEGRGGLHKKIKYFLHHFYFYFLVIPIQRNNKNKK